MTNVTEVIVLIAGQPQDDMQSFLLYMIAVIVSVIMIMYFLYIFKLIGGYIRIR